MVQHCLEAMTLGELSRLVYRDNVQVKHSARKRLHEEVQSKTRKLEHSLPQYGLNKLSILGPRHDLKVDPMSKLLVQYLLEVWSFGWTWCCVVGLDGLNLPCGWLMAVTEIMQSSEFRDVQSKKGFPATTMNTPSGSDSSNKACLPTGLQDGHQVPLLP